MNSPSITWKATWHGQQQQQQQQPHPAIEVAVDGAAAGPGAQSVRACGAACGPGACGSGRHEGEDRPEGHCWLHTGGILCRTLGWYRGPIAAFSDHGLQRRRAQGERMDTGRDPLSPWRRLSTGSFPTELTNTWTLSPFPLPWQMALILGIRAAESPSGL